MIKIITYMILIVGVIILLLLSDTDPVFIESLESKTIDDLPVYNQIAFESNENRDIWMMNQSHHGKNAQKNQLDRIVIIVDKNAKPKKATFIQLPPGELKWDNRLLQHEIEYKVSCYLCHSNGPRAIRPNRTTTISVQDEVKIMYWNIIIKSYGKIEGFGSQSVAGNKRKIPFKFNGPFDLRELKIDSCMQCHNGNSTGLNRAKLTQQNSMSIKFMIDNEFMPPLGHTLKKNEKEKIINFINGF